MRDFSVTSHTLGILSGIYFYSYAAMQLPVGMLTDRFGPHRLLTTATLICALSTIAFSMTNSFATACFARLMIGFGSAFAVVGTMKLASNWFSQKRFAFLTGLMVTIGMLGAIGGEAPLALLIDLLGWRQGMFALGSIGLVIALLIFLMAKDSPNQGKHMPHIEHEPPLFASLWQLMKNFELWLLAVFGGLVYLGTPVFCGLWGVPYLMLKFSITKAVAANYVSLIFIGWAVGSPLWGHFSNVIGRRKTSMYAAAIGGLLCMWIFIYSPIEQKQLIQISLCAFGFFSSGFLTAFAAAKELCPPNLVATSLSFMNMMNMIGIAIVQPMVGRILDTQWQGESIHGVRIYSVEAYQWALAVLPFGLIISIIILPFIRETYCHNIHDKSAV